MSRAAYFACSLSLSLAVSPEVVLAPSEQTTDKHLTMCTSRRAHVAVLRREAMTIRPLNMVEYEQTAGNDSDNGTLNVRPVITVQPAETILTSNRDIEQLQCVADAFPAPEYRWEMIEDGVVIETVSNTSFLMFNPVMFGDEGTYQCVAVSLGIQVNSTSSLVTGEYCRLLLLTLCMLLLLQYFENLST